MYTSSPAVDSQVLIILGLGLGSIGLLTQCGVTWKYKKSPANANGNAQQRCMSELWKPSETKSVARGCQTTGGKLSI